MQLFRYFAEKTCGLNMWFSRSSIRHVIRIALKTEPSANHPQHFNEICSLLIRAILLSGIARSKHVG